MDKKVLSIILIVVGGFFVVLPHSVHTSLGLSLVSHTVHVIFGLVCFVVGVIVGKHVKIKGLN